jgi:hypothetical protein
MISLAGVVAVLGFAAYMSLKSSTQPPATIRTVVGPVSKPATAARSPQLSSSAEPARPAAQEARLPERAPSLVHATEVRRRGTGSSPRQNFYPQVRSAVESAPAGGIASQPSAPVVTEASNLGAGPDVACTNNPPPPGAANPAPAPAAPATPASAVLMPHGSIVLNGHPAVDSTALFPGDRIQVPQGSYASINGQGSLTVLQPGSSAVYTGKGLDLQQGGVAVSTLEGMPVNTEGLNIAPSAGHGKYDVLDDNGTVQIASLEGDLSVMDGGKTTVLSAGQQTTLDKRKKAAADAPPDGPPAPETPPATASGGFPTTKVLLIGGAVGGGAAAAILLTRSSSKPVSPAVP